MDILAVVKNWSAALADVGVSLMALLIVLEVMMKGVALPFLPTVDVIGNITNIVKTLGSEGIIGLVAVFILYNIWKNK